LTESATPRIAAASPQEMSWAMGTRPRELEFDRAPLAQVVAEFNGINRIQIVIDDPALASMPIGASLRSDNVEGFVRILEKNFDVKAERRDGMIILHHER